MDEQYLSDETVLFSDDIENLVWIIDCCEAFTPVPKICLRLLRYKLSCSLLGLWCIKQDNKWDLADCNLSKCLKDIDEKLKQALVTRKSVDEAKQNESKRKKKGKEKKYPKNVEMVDAPDLFKDYLKIKCLTKDQLDVFNSNERFLWVEGPAGSGKTIAMLGKVIQLALTTPPQKRILVMTTRHILDSTAEILNNIRKDLTCEIITFPNRVGYSNTPETLDEATMLVLQKLSDSTSKIVLLDTINAANSLATTTAQRNTCYFMKRFDYIFLDDYQQLIDNMLSIYKDILSFGICPILEHSSKNNTSIWIVCDESQTWCIRYFDFIDSENGQPIVFSDMLKGYFENSKQLSINLRNTYEITSLLLIIIKHYKKIDFEFAGAIKWPRPETGHFLRGPKPVIYHLKNNVRAAWRHILAKEVVKLKEADNCLKNKDIAVVVYNVIRRYENDPDDVQRIKSVLESLGAGYDKIQVLSTGSSFSAEWPAVIFFCKYVSFTSPCNFPQDMFKVQNEKNLKCTVGSIIPELYLAISRARVYSSVILLSLSDSNKYTSKYDNELLEELKQRSDVCRVIEINNRSWVG